MFQEEKILAAVIILTALMVSMVMVATVVDFGQPQSGLEVLPEGEGFSLPLEASEDSGLVLQEGWQRFRCKLIKKNPPL